MAKTITFIPEEGLRPVLEQIAEKEDRSLAWVINKYLRQALEEEKKRKKAEKESRDS